MDPKTISDCTKGNKCWNQYAPTYICHCQRMSRTESHHFHTFFSLIRKECPTHLIQRAITDDRMLGSLVLIAFLSLSRHRRWTGCYVFERERLFEYPDLNIESLPYVVALLLFFNINWQDRFTVGEILQGEELLMMGDWAWNEMIPSSGFLKTPTTSGFFLF